MGFNYSNLEYKQKQDVVLGTKNKIWKFKLPNPRQESVSIHCNFGRLWVSDKTELRKYSLKKQLFKSQTSFLH